MTDAADWDDRFTRAVVANIAVLREEAGLSIDAFARRCDEAVGQPGRFKPNTIQGLFSGKRKGVTISELVVFSLALEVPLIALLVPIQRPGSVPSPSGELAAFAMWRRITGVRTLFGPSDLSRETSEGLAQIGEFARDLGSLTDDLFSFAYHHPDSSPDVTLLTRPEVLLAQVKGELLAVKRALREFDATGFTVEEDDPVVQWARVAEPKYLTVEVLTDVGYSLYERTQDSGARHGQAADPAE